MFEYLEYFYNFIRFFDIIKFGIFAGGFEIFGLKVWDFSAPFSYFEIFSSAFVICGSFYLTYLWLAKKAKRLESSGDLDKDSKDNK